MVICNPSNIYVDNATEYISAIWCDGLDHDFNVYVM